MKTCVKSDRKCSFSFSHSCSNVKSDSNLYIKNTSSDGSYNIVKKNIINLSIFLNLLVAFSIISNSFALKTSNIYYNDNQNNHYITNHFKVPVIRPSKYNLKSLDIFNNNYNYNNDFLNYSNFNNDMEINNLINSSPKNGNDEEIISRNNRNFQNNLNIKYISPSLREEFDSNINSNNNDDLNNFFGDISKKLNTTESVTKEYLDSDFISEVTMINKTIADIYSKYQQTDNKSKSIYKNIRKENILHTNEEFNFKLKELVKDYYLKLDGKIDNNNNLFNRISSNNKRLAKSKVNEKDKIYDKNDTEKNITTNATNTTCVKYKIEVIKKYVPVFYPVPVERRINIPVKIPIKIPQRILIPQFIPYGVKVPIPVPVKLEIPSINSSMKSNDNDKIINSNKYLNENQIPVFHHYLVRDKINDSKGIEISKIDINSIFDIKDLEDSSNIDKKLSNLSNYDKLFNKFIQSKFRNNMYTNRSHVNDDSIKQIHNVFSDFNEDKASNDSEQKLDQPDKRMNNIALKERTFRKRNILYSNESMVNTTNINNTHGIDSSSNNKFNKIKSLINQNKVQLINDFDQKPEYANNTYLLVKNDKENILRLLSNMNKASLLAEKNKLNVNGFSNITKSTNTDSDIKIAISDINERNKALIDDIKQPEKADFNKEQLGYRINKINDIDNKMKENIKNEESIENFEYSQKLSEITTKLNSLKKLKDKINSKGSNINEEKNKQNGLFNKFNSNINRKNESDFPLFSTY